jgi:hypothetical protein
MQQAFVIKHYDSDPLTLALRPIIVTVSIATTAEESKRPSCGALESSRGQAAY